MARSRLGCHFVALESQQQVAEEKRVAALAAKEARKMVKVEKAAEQAH
jgi:hypothetical protein